MQPCSRLLWALGINGEGSARVTYAFIKYICSPRHNSSHRTTVVYTACSTLEELIHPLLSTSNVSSPIRNVRFVRLPKLFRNYLVHFAIKTIINPSILFNSIVVFDDYPFRFAERQVLYFHQPNLIYNQSFIWRLKRHVFKILLSNSLVVYIQTKHMRTSFVQTFGDFKILCFLHNLS